MVDEGEDPDVVVEAQFGLVAPLGAPGPAAFPDRQIAVVRIVRLEAVEAILSELDARDIPTLLVHNKVDLLPHLDFDMEQAIANLRRVNPDCAILPVSARTGEGLEAWIGWLDEVRTAASAADPAAAE